MKKILFLSAFFSVLLISCASLSEIYDRMHRGNDTIFIYHESWSWISGTNITNFSGSYGTKGVADKANFPGARASGMNWVDGSGNLWLFGGMGCDGFGNYGNLNDLWKFENMKWTWVSGTNINNVIGIYGTKGVPNPSNIPGSRTYGLCTRDQSGIVWLFGGYGYDSIGFGGNLSDLWKWDGTNWTWISGTNMGNIRGKYGTIGVTSVSNYPGGRNSGSMWIDSSGYIWIFGGFGIDSAGSSGRMNDLWKWDGTNWTWVSGTNIVNIKGVYGSKGVANPANIPGGRVYVANWKDGLGNFWIFGGAGADSVGTTGSLNDLWKWDGANWTWVSGTNIANSSGSYGTIRITSSTNVPGSRNECIGWIDNYGNFWLFGGVGYDSMGSFGLLNDLWKWDGVNWTWVSGTNITNMNGCYGTFGVANTTNIPGARKHGVVWTDGQGCFWLFGGNGDDSIGASGYLNDLWQYTP